MKDIAPSNALRKWFGHKPERWPQFRRKYRPELTQKKELLAELKRAEKVHRKVTLLFGAKDPEHNQAVVLANVLKNKK